MNLLNDLAHIRTHDLSPTGPEFEAAEIELQQAEERLIAALSDEQQTMFEAYESAVLLRSSLDLKAHYRKGLADGMELERSLRAPIG